MKKYNIIPIFKVGGNGKVHVLMCKRTKEPYKDKYNFVGGKIIEGEISFNAAYRELEEETGITREQVKLHHVIDFTFYAEDILLEVFTGLITSPDIELKEEVNPLTFINIGTIANSDSNWLFAGDGNIPYIINYILIHWDKLFKEG